VEACGHVKICCRRVEVSGRSGSVSEIHQSWAKTPLVMVFVLKSVMVMAHEAHRDSTESAWWCV
jgi:hypothetical protein